MNTLVLPLKHEYVNESIARKSTIPVSENHNHHGSYVVHGIQARIIFYLIGLRIITRAVKKYSSWRDALFVVKKLLKFRLIINDGKVISKYVKANGKYYRTLYAPGFPSKQLDRMYDFEMERIKSESTGNSLLRFAFLAITTKCPLKCEHCFEWENLNKQELMKYDDLRNVVLRLKEAGVIQVFLSGGEPMLRVKDIIRLADEFHGDLDLWVLTSGFNATSENLSMLKKSGITGLFVSLDHYDKNLHNAFRGSAQAYDDAIHAIKNARALDMVVGMSLCVTKALVNHVHLMNYARLAKSSGASFIQLLEPKAVGHYASKDVLLNEKEQKIIEEFSSLVNHNKEFRDFPVVLYHGYQQRQVGCFAAGNRSLYIDSNGDIMSCPFCHHKSGNVLKDDLLDKISCVGAIGCTDFKVASI